MGYELKAEGKRDGQTWRGRQKKEGICIRGDHVSILASRPLMQF